MSNKEIFKWQSQVRDYELDRQNIVNHATFINYIEEARNEYARAVGIDFSEFQKAGYDFVIAGLEIQYRYPLFAQDKFYITVEIESYDEKRLNFTQEVHRCSDDKLISKAVVHTACVDLKTGKSCFPDILKNIIIKIENLAA